MSDPLYQEAILALARRAREIGRIQEPTVSARVDNPVCGDRVTMDLVIADGRIRSVGAKVQGCALCQAATTLIADAVADAAPGDLAAAAEQVADYLKGAGKGPAWVSLANFDPVRDAKSRHECVVLPFKAMKKALAEAEPVSS